MKVCCRKMMRAIADGNISVINRVPPTLMGNNMIALSLGSNSVIYFCPFCGRDVELAFEEDGNDGYTD